MIKYNRIVAMICYSTLSLVLILTLVFFLIQKKSKELNDKRISLIDIVGENYIFRGSNPLITKNRIQVFAYEELTSYLDNYLSKQGRKNLSNGYYLIDISLLDLDEYYIIEEEKRFFSQNPKKGMTKNISTLSPNLLLAGLDDSNFIMKKFSDHYSKQVTKILNQIHDPALQQGDKPTVIYIHCDGGRDRTGLITAGYRLLFKDIGLSEARLKNVQEVGRDSESFYYRAIGSYCLYVKNNYGKPDEYCD